MRLPIALALMTLIGLPYAVAEDEPTHEERALALFKQHDKDRNNVLRDEELPEKWLDRFDSDADDEISKREFMDVQSRPARFRVIHPLRDVRARVNFDLRSFDRNKDGLVQAEEYPGDAKRFAKFDKNDDGALEWKELIRLARDEIDEIRKTMRSPNRLEFLRIHDLNGDRRIDSEEYDGSDRNFRKYDTDGDGTVTYAELYPERMMEGPAEAPPIPEQDVIGSMDTDDDGRVSREEFKGTDAAWRRLDRNGDGVISKSDRR